MTHFWRRNSNNCYIFAVEKLKTRTNMNKNTLKDLSTWFVGIGGIIALIADLYLIAVLTY